MKNWQKCSCKMSLWHNTRFNRIERKSVLLQFGTHMRLFDFANQESKLGNPYLPSIHASGPLVSQFLDWNTTSLPTSFKLHAKEIQIIHRLFLAIAMYCWAPSMNHKTSHINNKYFCLYLLLFHSVSMQ